MDGVLLRNTMNIASLHSPAGRCCSACREPSDEIRIELPMPVADIYPAVAELERLYPGRTLRTRSPSWINRRGGRGSGARSHTAPYGPLGKTPLTKTAKCKKR